MSQQFYHSFYVILGVDETNGTKLIKVGNTQDHGPEFEYKTPPFVPRSKFVTRELLTSTDQIETIEGQMKNICKSHGMQPYDMQCHDMNHNGCAVNEFFAINKTRENNINALVDIFLMFYDETCKFDPQSYAVSVYNSAFK